MARKAIGAKISPELLIEARSVAESKGLPLNALIERAIEQYVRQTDDLALIAGKLDDILELLKDGNNTAVDAPVRRDEWDIIRPSKPRKN